MKPPAGANRVVDPKITDGVARKLSDHLAYSQNTFRFIWLVLFLIRRNASLRQWIGQMVPHENMLTLINLMDIFFISDQSTGVETKMFHDENMMNTMVQMIHTLFPLYMTGYGKLRTLDRSTGRVTLRFYCPTK